MTVDNGPCWFYNGVICINVMDSSRAVYYSTINATRKFSMIYLSIRVWINWQWHNASQRYKWLKTATTFSWRSNSCLTLFWKLNTVEVENSNFETILNRLFGIFFSFFYFTIITGSTITSMVIGQGFPQLNTSECIYNGYNLIDIMYVQ